MLEKTGIPTQSQIESVFPSQERLQSGPVAIIECFQPIPCNPCATSCPQGAILPFENIYDLPITDNDKCNGCGICIIKCPGLAIIVVDINWSDEKALIKLPYEFTPLPSKGQTVQALDRSGSPIGNAEVINITQPKSKTPIISVAINKNMIKTVRNIKFKAVDNDNVVQYEIDFHKQSKATSKIDELQLNESANSIICRCSDITREELHQLIAQGHTSIDEIKRVSRLGMGPCQGRTCIPLAIRELSQILQKPMAELAPATHRPVVTSIKLGQLAQ